MSRFDHRLRRLARQFGCQQHGEPLICHACHPSDPLPERISSGLDAFLDGMISRVGPDAFRLQMPAARGACPRCKAELWCGACYEEQMRRLVASIGLTDSEWAQLDDLSLLCRTLQP